MYKKLNIYTHTKASIDKLTKGKGVTIAQWVDDAVKYFETTGVQPSAEFYNVRKSFEHIDRLVKARTDTIIGFFKENEKRYLLPLFARQTDILDLLAEGAVRVNTDSNVAVENDFLPSINSATYTAKDEDIYKLKEEQERLRKLLREVVSAIDVSKLVTGGTRYNLNITESFYNELKTENLE